MGLLARGEAVLAGILRGVVGALMLGAVGVNLANIVGRYVFARPFIWAKEIMQFLDVWAVMRMMYPRLVQNGYRERFSLGLITATGAIDILIPPSIMMILYCVSAEQSVAKLFIAGFIPGLLLAAMEGGFVVWYAWRYGVPRTQRLDLGEVRRATVDATWAFLVPIVIFAGIYGGIFTPTEAAGVAAVEPAEEH